MGRKVVAGFVGTNKDHCLLALAVLLGRTADDPLSAFFLSLPSDFSGFPLAGDFRPDWLRGSPTLAELDRFRLEIESDWAQLTDIAPELQRFSFKDFLAARLIVSSRSFSVCRSPCLVPVADMLDHSDTPNVVWSVASDAYELRSDCEVAQGSELFISYGWKSNASLLVKYGFVLPGHDEYPLKVCMDTSARGFETKRAMLGGQVSRTFFINAHSGSATLEEVLGFCRFAQLRDMKTLPQLIELYGDLEADAFDSRCVPFLSIENEYAALSLLEVAVQTSLQAYPSTLAEDEQEVAVDGLHRGCLVVRMGEKRVLGRLSEFVSRAKRLLVGGRTEGTAELFPSYFPRLKVLLQNC